MQEKSFSFQNGTSKVLFKRKAEIEHRGSPRLLHATSPEKAAFHLTEFGWRHATQRILFCPPLSNVVMSTQWQGVTAQQCSEVLPLPSDWTCHIHQCRDLKEASLWLKAFPQTDASSPDHWEAFSIQDHCLVTSYVVLPSADPERSEFQPESVMKAQVDWKMPCCCWHFKSDVFTKRKCFHG